MNILLSIIAAALIQVGSMWSGANPPPWLMTTHALILYVYLKLVDIHEELRGRSK